MGLLAAFGAAPSVTMADPTRGPTDTHRDPAAVNAETQFDPCLLGDMWAKVPVVDWVHPHPQDQAEAETLDRCIGVCVAAEQGAHRSHHLGPLGRHARRRARLLREDPEPRRRGPQAPLRGDLDLPPGASLTISGEACQETPRRYARRGPSGSGAFWTGSTLGEVCHLVIVVPASALEEDLYATLSHIVRRHASEERFPANGLVAQDNDLPCHDDVVCSGAVGSERNAVVKLSYVSSNREFICSGVLLNDKASDSRIPWLLTANHCIDRQSVAETAEVRWFFEASSCNGPLRRDRVTTEGAALVATEPDTDTTLLRLV